MPHSASSRGALLLAVSAASLASLLVLTSIAGAAHTRPKGASPQRTAYVVAYDECTSPTMAHESAFVGGSCAPSPTSPWLRVGTPDANGIPASFVGSSRLTVTPTDIAVDVSLTDIHCSAAGGPACPAGAFPGGYGGTVGVHYLLRITDHCNGPPPPGSGCPPLPPPPGPAGTVQDLPFIIPTPCGPVPPPPAGSDCSISTSFNGVLPGAIVPGQRMNVRLHEVHVTDGGADGDASTVDASQRRFLYEGVFVP